MRQGAFLIYFLVFGVGASFGAARAPAQSSDKPLPAMPAVPIDTVPVYTEPQIKDLIDRIDKLEPVLTEAEKDIKLRKEYLALLRSLLGKAKEVNATSQDLGRAIADLAKPPKKEPTASILTIISAKYGDLRNNHVCDATGFLQENCKLATASATVTAAYCIIKSWNPTDVCGVDPSPQGHKEILIEYKCGDQTRELPLRLADHAIIRMICHVPDAPRTSSSPGS